VALDWLAVGLDPERSSFVIESLIPEHAELTVWLSWLLPLGMLERNPDAEGGDGGVRPEVRAGAFFTYPVMQVANILIAQSPLGPGPREGTSFPHIELTREVARRFNRQFKEVFSRAGGLVGGACRGWSGSTDRPR